MRNVSRLFLIVVAVFVFILSHSAMVVGAEESSCVSCHTSFKKLLKVTRDIEAANPADEEPAESEGEG